MPYSASYSEPHLAFAAFECVPRVRGGHDELGARDGGDLGIEPLGRDRERRALRHEVADVAEERLVLDRVDRGSGTCAVPAVDLALQALALREQLAIPGGESVDEIGEPLPEHAGLDAAPGERIVFEEPEQRDMDAESPARRCVLLHLARARLPILLKAPVIDAAQYS